MSRQNPLGVIVVGAGEMGARHARHWHAAGARVVAVCDPDTRRAEAAAQAVGALAAADYTLLLGRADVQLASVCTPTHVHAPFTVACLDAGLHVLCEKPVALELASARAMLDAADRNQRQLRIGFMRRFDPVFNELRRLVNQQAGVVYGSVRITAGIRPKRLMHDKHANGGPLVDMCCHIFDVWKLLFGKPALLRASGSTYGADSPALASIGHKAVDSAVATFGFAAGHQLQLLISWGLPEGVPFSETHSYTAKTGLIEVDWNYRANTVSLHNGLGLNVYRAERDPYQAQISQYYRELTEDAPRRVADAQDGIEALGLSLDVLAAVEGT